MKRKALPYIKIRASRLGMPCNCRHEEVHEVIFYGTKPQNKNAFLKMIVIKISRHLSMKKDGQMCLSQIKWHAAGNDMFAALAASQHPVAVYVYVDVIDTSHASLTVRRAGNILLTGKMSRL